MAIIYGIRIEHFWRSTQAATQTLQSFVKKSTLAKQLVFIYMVWSSSGSGSGLDAAGGASLAAAASHAPHCTRTLLPLHSLLPTFTSQPRVTSRRRRRVFETNSPECSRCSWFVLAEDDATM